MSEVEEKKEAGEERKQPPMFSRRYKIYLAIMIPLVLLAVGVLAYFYISSFASIDRLMSR